MEEDARVKAVKAVEAIFERYVILLMVVMIYCSIMLQVSFICFLFWGISIRSPLYPNPSSDILNMKSFTHHLIMTSGNVLLIDIYPINIISQPL